jgi:hypothetical protein
VSTNPPKAASPSTLATATSTSSSTHAMTTVDPSTGQPLSADAIQRVLFVCQKVHVYQIPPLTSAKGYNAASWTANPKSEIAVVRVRVIETALSDDEVSTAVVLETLDTGELFAAAPYTNAAVVEQVLDSSRFFAIRVQNGNMKATLGIGFEDRSQAFDFGVTLQEARKVMDGGTPTSKKEVEKQDFSLKEGEMITINLPGKTPKRQPTMPADNTKALFSIPPPPGAKKAEPSSSGFDDDFGDFQ